MTKKDSSRNYRILREARANLHLALPIVAAQFTFMGMGTVDTIMAGQIGADELAAVAVGSNAWFLLFILFMGIFMACSPIVAQRIGAGDDARRTGEFVRSAALLAVVLGMLWTALTHLAAPWIVGLLDLEPQAAAYAVDYLRAVSWGAVPFCLCFLGRNVAEGHALTRVALVAGLIGFAINGVLDYLLMYGALGFPRLGAPGCGWASACSGLAMMLVYGLFFVRLKRLAALELFRPQWPLHGDAVREVLRLGLPIGFILAAESWMFNIGALLMARFGGQTVAAHQVAINVAALTFMVPLSIGFATTVRVGRAAGARQPDEVRLRGRVGIGIGASFSLVSASLMALMPGVIVSAYTEVASVADIAVKLLYFAAVFQLFDCVQATANGALRGLKDTRAPMLITVSAYWVVGMPLAWWLAFERELGPYGVWWGFIAALAVAAVGLATRFVRLTRRSAPPASAFAP
ncbi:MAG: MATE family efflux transporter [Nevskiales bacterium]|nr:MATE family efflux transporter [Nevskiales bacterium]